LLPIENKIQFLASLIVIDGSKKQQNESFQYFFSTFYNSIKELVITSATVELRVAKEKIQKIQERKGVITFRILISRLHRCLKLSPPDKIPRTLNNKRSYDYDFFRFMSTFIRPALSVSNLNSALDQRKMCDTRVDFPPPNIL
jgi:hypothetical protein